MGQNTIDFVSKMGQKSIVHVSKMGQSHLILSYIWGKKNVFTIS